MFGKSFEELYNIANLDSDFGFDIDFFKSFDFDSEYSLRSGINKRYFSETYGAPSANDASLQFVASEILLDTEYNRVPVDTGVLKSTGKYWLTYKDGVRVAVVQYGGPDAMYAGYVHELPYRHPNGGEWRYLENAARHFFALNKGYSDLITAEMAPIDEGEGTVKLYIRFIGDKRKPMFGGYLVTDTIGNNSKNIYKKEKKEAMSDEEWKAHLEQFKPEVKKFEGLLNARQIKDTLDILNNL